MVEGMAGLGSTPFLKTTAKAISHGCNGLATVGARGNDEAAS